MARITRTALAIAALLATHGVARADDMEDVEDVQVEPEVVPEAERASPQAIDPFLNPPPAAPGITSQFYFEDRAQPDGVMKLQLGDEVKVLCGLHNGASSPLNVTYQLGMLQSSLYYQKLAPVTVNAVVDAGEELTLPFSFTPDKTLPPGEFTLSMSAFYEHEYNMFASTYFNQTVSLVEGDAKLDVQFIGLVVMMLLALAGISFVVMRTWFSSTLKKVTQKKSKAKVEMGTASSGDAANEWLQGTAATLGNNLGNTRSSKKKPASKGKKNK